MLKRLKLGLEAFIMFVGLDFKSSFESRISERMLRLERIVDRRFDSYLRNISTTSTPHPNRIQALTSRIKERRLNLHIKPEFTPEVVGVCKQILAFGAAGLGLAVAFSDNLDVASARWETLVIFVSIFYANLTITSLLVLIWFFVQARSRYPFLFLHHLGNRWPFFYYSTLRHNQHWRPLLSPLGIYRSNILYLRDLQKFTNNIVFEDQRPLEELKNEILQYFLLIRYQGFLDQYELQLVNLFIYLNFGGLLATCGIVFLA